MRLSVQIREIRSIRTDLLKSYTEVNANMIWIETLNHITSP